MAVLLLLSTTSWKVEKHYCMGRLMDVAWFTKVDTCGMDGSLIEEEGSKHISIGSCCDDEVFFVDGQKDLHLDFSSLEVYQPLFVANLHFTYQKVGALKALKQISREEYPPPLLIKDIQLLDEVFLI